MMGVCERCGSSIKNVFTYQGKTYGVECVLHVAGLKSYEVKNVMAGDVDEYLEKRAAKAAEFEAKVKAQEAMEIELKAIYEAKNEWLIDLLYQQDYKDIWSQAKGQYISVHLAGFYSSLADQLSMRSLQHLSDKQFNCIWDLLEKFPVKSLKAFSKELNIDLKAEVKKLNIEYPPSKFKKEDYVGILLSKF